MIVQTFKYRIYPTSKQKVRLINNFKICKQAYNELLAISKDTYKFGNVSLAKFDYNNIFKCYSSEIYAQVIQNVSDRLHKSFQNFFRRVKEKKSGKKVKVGYPRYKKLVKSITYPQNGFKFVNQRMLHASKIGNIPIVLHRVPKGKIKTLTIKRNQANQWFACFSCEMDAKKVIHHSKEKIGIDVGLENFATLSNGETVDNLRFLIKGEKRLKRLNRRVSRKIKGSANRRKARFRLSKQHIKVTNQRTDFLHKLSRNLAFKYSIIAVEDLKINRMVKNHIFAKRISDVTWGNFINMLSYKEVIFGGHLLKNPKTRGSSHRCNICGFYVEDMPLSKRIFKCPKCLNVCHRDHNSALNHLKDTAGLAEISTPVDIEPLCHLSNGESSVVETGTICDKFEQS